MTDYPTSPYEPAQTPDELPLYGPFLPTPVQDWKTIGLSVVRTFVPVIVGAVITVLTKIGADVSSESLELLIGSIVTTAYYTVARVLETKVTPRFGWLLGAPRTPTY
jgi:hypothetical protein